MGPTEQIAVRAFRAGDAAPTLRLMRQLAAFEGYLEAFAPTEENLRQHGTGDAARFHALLAVAGKEEEVVGVAVLVEIPWTFDLRPTLMLKELFVDQRARGRGVGRALMTAVARHSLALGAPRVEWKVLPENTRAQAFYAELGG
ncbi:MAG: GNAT family N-acetyltransferase, partial [Pseudomonadota bacterium]